MGERFVDVRAASAAGAPAARPPPVDFVGEFPGPEVLYLRSLQTYGLSAREARMYFALLRSGPTGAREATKLSGLNRATGYRLLSRLLARGLVRTDGHWPQRFHPVTPQVLIDRTVMFLRDEIELDQWIAGVYAASAATAGESALERRPPVHGIDPDRSPTPAPRMVSWGTPNTSIPLTSFRAATRGLDALVRPRAIPGGLRAAVAAALAHAAARGIGVRVVLDCATADHRFAELLRRESGSHGPGLEIRHFTPLGGHLYVTDGRSALRFPEVGRSNPEAEVGLVSEGREFVQAQLARFAAVWSDAVVALGPLGSTRRFGWGEPSAVSTPARAEPGWSRNGRTDGRV